MTFGLAWSSAWHQGEDVLQGPECVSQELCTQTKHLLSIETT